MEEVTTPIPSNTHLREILNLIAIRLHDSRAYESLIDLSSILRYPFARRTLASSCKIVKNQQSMTKEVTGVSFVLDSAKCNGQVPATWRDR